MWRKEKTDSSMVDLPLLLALVTTPMVAAVFVSNFTLAKVSSDTLSYPFGETLTSSTQRGIDGLISISAINPPVAEKVAEAAASNETSSGSQALIPSADKKQNAELVNTLRWLLLVPVSIVCGLLLWKVQHSRSSREDKNAQIAENSATAEDASKATDTASLTARALESGRHPTAYATNSQLQETKVQFAYPPLPDVWDEVETDTEQLFTEAVSVSPKPLEAEEVVSKEQSTVAVDTVVPDATEVSQVATPEVTDVNALLPIVTVIPQTVSQTPAKTTEVPVSLTELPDEIVLDMEAPVALVTPLYPELSEIAAVTSTVQDERHQIETVASELLDVSDDIQQNNDWFVADAELIIHGSAKLGSTVTVDGHSVNLKQDGTFQLRIPFTENAIEHRMEARTNDGEQEKTIHMKFVKEVSET